MNLAPPRIAAVRTISAQPKNKKWTERELLALPKDDGKYELVNGELVLMSPAGLEHGGVSVRISGRLDAHVFKHKLGRVFDGQSGFWMKSGNLRSPDVSFISKARLGSLEILPTGFFKGAPDLAIEVLSPRNSASHINEKIADYFDSGTKLVWIIKPKTRSAKVYRLQSRAARVGPAEILDGMDVVPGFKLRVDELFL